MSNAIRISPKHGLNPTIPVCFFCGKEKNQLILMGRLKDDAEAPKNTFFDYEPCEECRKKFDQGILLIGVSETSPDGRPPIAKGAYPTGVYAVLKREAIERLFGPEEATPTLKAGKALMDEKELKKLLSPERREGDQ